MKTRKVENVRKSLAVLIEKADAEELAEIWNHVYGSPGDYLEAIELDDGAEIFVVVKENYSNSSWDE